MQICTVCKVEKDFSEYYFRKERGCYYKQCKKCRNKKIVAYQKRPENIETYREYTRNYNNSEAGKSRNRIHKKKTKHKVKARAQLNYQVKLGKIKKQPCHCGDINVHGHHEDYSKPLDVIWLCPKHHGEVHAND